MQKVKHYTQVDHFIYDNGVIYCYAGDTLFRINSFSFYAVPEESDLEPYVEYTYRESDDGGRYCAENGEQLKKGKLEPYLKSSELRFDFDGLEAGYLWSKKDGIYPIRQESIADTYAKAKVFQWQDFSFAYEDQQGRIYYNPHQEKEATEYTLYLTAADSLKGSTATVSSLFSPEVGGETHIVIDSGKTQFFLKAHTLAGVVALLYGLFRLAFCLYRQDGKKGLIRYRFEGLTVYHLVFIQESQDLRFWAAVWYAFIWEICLCKMQESYSVFHFLQLHLHWQS